MEKHKKISRCLLVLGFILISPAAIGIIYSAVLWVIQMIESKDIAALVTASFFTGLMCVFIGAVLCFDDDDDIDLYY